MEYFPQSASLPFQQAPYTSYAGYRPTSPLPNPNYLTVPGQGLHRSNSSPGSTKKKSILKTSPYLPEKSTFEDHKSPLLGAYQTAPISSKESTFTHPLYTQPAGSSLPQPSPFLPFQEPLQRSPYPSTVLPTGPAQSTSYPGIDHQANVHTSYPYSLGHKSSPYPGAFQPGLEGYNQHTSSYQNPYASYNPNAPYLHQQKPSALSAHIQTLKAKIPREPIDVTNAQTKYRNELAHEIANLKLGYTRAPKKKSKKDKKEKLFNGYKFNPRAFETPFHKSKTMNYLQIVTHQANSSAPMYEYLLMRPFHPNFVSPTGLRVEIGYDSDSDQYYSKLSPNVDPTRAPDYVGVRNIGVVTDEKAFYAVANFLPVPMAGGRSRRPGKGERAVPLETFRGWSSLIIMECKHRGILLTN